MWKEITREEYLHIFDSISNTNGKELRVFSSISDPDGFWGRPLMMTEWGVKVGEKYGKNSILKFEDRRDKYRFYKRQ